MKVALQIPDGNRCEDCMFLKVYYFDNHAECLLFGGRLQWDYEYGNIVEKTIKKCDKCRQIVRNCDD